MRYADDAVLVFEHEDDARRVLVVLAKRLEKYGLRLHRDDADGGVLQTVEIEARNASELRDVGVHPLWGRSRKGRWVVKRKTAKDRFSRALRAMGRWCRNNRHRSLREQHAALSGKLRGHDAYYGVTGNAPALTRLRFAVARQWCKWLDRRGGRVPMTWKRFKRS